MSKSIIFGAMAVAAIVFANPAHAQTKNTAQTTVNIQLADVIEIESNSGASKGVVNFNYPTVESYQEGQNWNVPKSLIVTSSKNFDVKVKANGADFVSGQNRIPVNVLTIKPVKGGTTTMVGTFTNVALSTNDQNLVTAADLGNRLSLDLNYEISREKASSPDILGKVAGKYTQTVTYTATAL